MEFKDFDYNGITYTIEFFKENLGEIKVFQNIYGNQKSIIINKLLNIIETDKDHGIPDNIVNYIINYAPGNKTDSQTTRSLGKILFNYLNRVS